MKLGMRVKLKTAFFCTGKLSFSFIDWCLFRWQILYLMFYTTVLFWWVGSLCQREALIPPMLVQQLRTMLAIKCVKISNTDN